MRVYEIGICDDYPQVAQALAKTVTRLSEKNSVTVSCRIFHSGEELLKNINQFSVVFLDIEMPGLDGVETGKKIRQLNPDCRIIMATGRVDRISEVFFFQAFRFVKKPFRDEEVEEALISALKKRDGEETIEVYLDRNLCEVKQKDIVYVQAFNGYSEFVINGKRFRRETSLNDVEEELNPRLFFRIHRQYIVNFGSIEGRTDSYVVVGGTKIPISRRKRKDFEKEYIKYDVNRNSQ